MNIIGLVCYVTCNSTNINKTPIKGIIDKSEKILFICLGIILFCVLLMIITGCGIFNKCIKSKNSEKNPLLESSVNVTMNASDTNEIPNVLPETKKELKSADCVICSKPKLKNKDHTYQNVNIIRKNDMPQYVITENNGKCSHSKKYHSNL